MIEGREGDDSLKQTLWEKTRGWKESRGAGEWWTRGARFEEEKNKTAILRMSTRGGKKINKKDARGMPGCK